MTFSAVSPSVAATNPSSKLANKAEEIRHILSEPTVDLWRLRELAISEGGLVNGTFSVGSILFICGFMWC